MRFFTQRRKDRKDAKKNHERLCVFAPLRLCVKTFLLILCLCSLFAACSKNNTTTNTPVISNPPTGTTYPMPPSRAASLANMGWELSDGNRSIFSEYKGKVLILDFYATWCEPCRDSIPHLIGLQKKYEDQGLQVVGL